MQGQTITLNWTANVVNSDGLRLEAPRSCPTPVVCSASHFNCVTQQCVDSDTPPVITDSFSMPLDDRGQGRLSTSKVGNKCAKDIFSVAGIIKSLTKNTYNNCYQMSFPSQNTPKSMSAGVSPQTPLGELTALPRTFSWFQGGRFATGGNGEEGREGLWGKREREGKWEMGKERERGKLEE